MAVTDSFNNSLARSQRTIWTLAACQALGMTANTVILTTAALTGYALAADKGLATLPVALLQIATMLTTIPAALLMQRLGRRLGFGVGVVLGLVAALLAMQGIEAQSFGLFTTGVMIYGCANGFAGYYRFAAAEVAPEAGRAKAVSMVVAGGVVAAVCGPTIATVSQHWLLATFAGCYAAIAVLQGLSLALVTSLKLPPSPAMSQGGRALSEIIRQPVFLVAVVASMFGYGVMALLMTATPLAMTAHHFSFDQAASVIQWHVLGMFAPSFFTGTLIAHFGVLTVMAWGALLNLICITINVAGVDFHHFWAALILLGIGWNFLFVGATTLLTQAHTPFEKAKTQAAHDFIMFSCVAASTFSSGPLLNHLGWSVLNLLAIPMIGIALGGVLWLRYRPLVRPAS